MAQAIVRIAAGGVVATSLLIVGPLPAQAFADKHGSDSHYKPGNDRRGPGPGLIKDIRDGLDAFGGSKPSTVPPTMNLGSDGSDLGEVVAPDSVENFAVADGPVALRSAAVQGVPNVNAAGAVPPTGSGYTAPPAVTIRAPRVVIGDGRTPRWHGGARDAEPISLSAGQALGVPEEVPPQPVAIEIDIPPLPPPLPPIEKMRPARLVESDIDTAGLDTVTDPLAGLAGLILIPAVGAVLGVRQARAAQAVRESART